MVRSLRLPLLKTFAAVVAIAVAACTLVVAAQERFRTDVAIVTLNVAVRQNGTPVRDLKATDFDVTDNGVHQDVELTPVGVMPADVTVLVDTSASMDATLEQTRAQLADIAKQLRHDDRVRVLTVADDVREVFGFRAGGSAPPMDALAAGGWTSLYDALGLALIHRPSRERGHLIVTFSDGIDSSSTIDLDTVTALARRSEAVVDLFVLVPKPLWQSPRALPSREEPTLPPVARLVQRTGGDTRVVRATDNIAAAFRDALTEYRRRYVLRYAMPAGAPGSWHDVKVAITQRGRFDVLLRDGYTQ